MMLSVKQSWWLTNSTPEPTGVNWITGGFIDDNNNNILTSIDGTSWQYGRIPNLEDVRCLTWINNQWVAGGTPTSGNNTMATSPDGITWTAKSCPLDFRVRDIAFENDIYLIGGVTSDFSGTICYSTDFNNWTKVNVNNTFDITTNSFSYGNGIWIAAGEHDAPGVTNVNTSPDGINWTRRLNNESSPAGLTTFFKNGIFFYGGNTIGGSYPALTTTTDGINFNTLSTGFTEYVWTVDYINDMYVAGGTGSGRTIATSPNGTAWTNQVGVPEATAIGAFASNDTQLICVGADTEQVAGTGIIIQTTNASTWTKVLNTNQQLYCIGVK